MPVVFGVPGFSLLPFLTYETIITGSDSPESQRHMLPLNTGEPGELGDGNSSVAPPAVYGRGLYLFRRGIGCVSCASKDAGNIALLPVFVNSCKPLTAKLNWYNDEVGRIGLHFDIFLVRKRFRKGPIIRPGIGIGRVMFTKHDHRPEGAINRAATPTQTLPGEKISTCVSNSSN